MGSAMKINLLENREFSWLSYGSDARFNYPIGYHGALLDHDDQGHLDLLYRWDPVSIATSIAISVTCAQPSKTASSHR